MICLRILLLSISYNKLLLASSKRLCIVKCAIQINVNDVRACVRALVFNLRLFQGL